MIKGRYIAGAGAVRWFGFTDGNGGARVYAHPHTIQHDDAGHLETATRRAA